MSFGPYTISVLTIYNDPFEYHLPVLVMRYKTCTSEMCMWLQLSQSVFLISICCLTWGIRKPPWRVLNDGVSSCNTYIISVFFPSSLEFFSSLGQEFSNYRDYELDLSPKILGVVQYPYLWVENVGLFGLSKSCLDHLTNAERTKNQGLYISIAWSG
jgi:hypothetical protein